MSEYNITVEGGTSKRLLTAGKYCDRDIVVTATGGGASREYERVDYIQFDGNQVINTGIVCNQDTKAQIYFTRDTSESQYLYGVVSSGNTASFTAYMSSNGAWRVGNKWTNRTIPVNPDLVNAAIVTKTGVVHNAGTSAISGVTDFETPYALALGGATQTDGTLGAQYVGKMLLFELWQGDELVRKFVPVKRADGVYGFLDEVSGEFFASETDTPFDGGNW